MGKKVRKPRDPLLDNPAVMVYKGVLHLTANEQQRVEIAAKVSNLEIWEDTLKHWKSHQWNPRNVPGQLDLYGKGGAEGCEYCHGSRKNGHAPKPKPGSAFVKLREESKSGDTR